MAIARGNVSNGAQSATTSLTVSHTTTTGTNGVLIVAIELQTGDNVTGVTFNGTPLTQFNKVATTIASYQNYFYYLINPGSGVTANIVVSCSGSRRIIALNADYTGVHQTTPLAVSTNNITTAAAGSLTLTTTADNSWLVGSIRCNATNPTGAGANTIEVTKAASELGYVLYDSNGAKTPTGSYSLNVTFSGSQLFCMLGAQLSPASTSTSSAFLMFM